jgi:tRNA (guanine37-N1)-methyltransferase
MRFDIITLFPDMIQNGSSYGVTGKAIDNGRVTIKVWNPRDYATDKYRTVDDRPYGGGPGMVMKFQPLYDAVQDAKSFPCRDRKVVYLSPQGIPITQQLLIESSQLEQIILVAGRYEGIDERFIESECDEEWSLGDFVISGGELAALVVIDGITRLLPGVLGDENSALQDSHMDGLLDCPHYTRPETSDWGDVPSVLLSGHHQAIERWRLQQALGRTDQRRPDLIAKKNLTAEQKALLEQFRNENVKCN